MEDNLLMIDNMEIDRKEETVKVSINPNLYPLEVIYSAAYVFIDRAYVIIDGDPKEEIIVQIKPKLDSNVDVETLGREFSNELLNYMVYMQRSARSQSIRETIVQRALTTNIKKQSVKSSSSNEDRIYIEDLEEIAKPWKPKD